MSADRPEPHAVLGLPPDATPAEVRAARRRLAKVLHPDVGGDVAAMQAVNAAADSYPFSTRTGRVEIPVEIVVDALPVVACLALLRAIEALGEVLDADEPYRIDGRLDDPACLITLELVPVAGGSLVTLTTDWPDPDEVIDALQELCG